MPRKFPVVDGSLSRDRIEALVLAAIKSPSPIERRKAFDRLLQEMDLPTFTAEQSMLIRRAMFENGADGEQWRLFDYAWGSTAPDAAIALIDEIPARFRDAYLGNILPGLASSEPQAAIELFSSLEPELQAKLRNRFFEGLIDYDVATATEHIFAATDERAYDWRPMDVMTREIVKDRGLKPALEWAAELQEGPCAAAPGAPPTPTGLRPNPTRPSTQSSPCPNLPIATRRSMASSAPTPTRTGRPPRSGRRNHPTRDAGRGDGPRCKAVLPPGSRSRGTMVRQQRPPTVEVAAGLKLSVRCPTAQLAVLAPATPSVITPLDGEPEPGLTSVCSSPPGGLHWAKRRDDGPMRPSIHPRMYSRTCSFSTSLRSSWRKPSHSLSSRSSLLITA